MIDYISTYKSPNHHFETDQPRMNAEVRVTMTKL